MGFIVTNMSASAEGVVHFYNGRGTAEQWIKEGKYAGNPDVSGPSVRGQPGTAGSVHPFDMLGTGLAYNLGNFLRPDLSGPKAVKHWSLRSVQIKLIKIGARLVRHARRPRHSRGSLRWLCLGKCSGKYWSVSPGSIQHQASEYP